MTTSLKLSGLDHSTTTNPMFTLINTTCPYAKWVQTARKLCPDPNKYHCLNDEFGRPGWLCADPIWVEGGRCPEFNTIAKKLDTVSCEGENCPDTVFQSSFVHLYLSCRGEGVEKTTSSNFDLTTEAVPLDSPASIGITVGIIAGVVLIAIAVVALCHLLRRRRQNKKDSEAGLAMLATPEPNDGRSYSRAQRALRTERFVVITGIQGSGKTFLAKRLCNEWFQEEKCIWITDPQHFQILLDFNSVFVLDDLFHELQSEDQVREMKANIDKLYENVVVKRNGKIILTVTSLILRRLVSVFEERKYKNIIDLDELSKEDREDILQFHTKLNKMLDDTSKIDDTSKSQNSSTVIRDTDFQRMIEYNSEGTFDYLVEKRGMGYSAAMALCCMFNTDNQKEFDAKCGRYVKSPVAWLRQDLKEMFNENNIERKREAIALSLLALHGGQFKLSDLNTALMDKLMELENVKHEEEGFLIQAFNNQKRKYVYENDGVYSFQVPVVMKFLFRIICERHTELLEFCEKDLCKRRVCFSSLFPTDIKGDYAKSFVSLSYMKMLEIDDWFSKENLAS
ncbi:uncharacterized protein LOC133195124 [Saccostrea echinata]|uniref:uncharacterized protein LOC133195124 n=1 Tax=Saccostrea echinata TaxID=191078 RepID=UPI002A80EEE2|nr:uncharacterized protein LOC133195124 [Saccostrea echinata]